MNLRKLILACLMTLFLAAPAYAADIILDGACTLHDAIIAANTDSPAGNCSAGSGADRINVQVSATRDTNFGAYRVIYLNASLPPITSTISIFSDPAHGVNINGQGEYRAFLVESGGRLTLNKVLITWAKGEHGAAILVKGGGAAELNNIWISVPNKKPPEQRADVQYGCGAAIYNEGVVNIRGDYNSVNSYYSHSTILNNGGTMSIVNMSFDDFDHDLVNIGGGRLSLGGWTRYFTGILEEIEDGHFCTQKLGRSAVAGVPAPECKLEPQLQAGDRAIRRGGSYSNLRAEAGISGERVGRIEGGAVVDVIEGPVEAGGYNWYRVTAEDELEGWVAEGPARSFNCAYYFVGFSGELPPAAPETIPERQQCDLAEPLVVGGYAIIAGSVHINYRAEAGLGGSRLGTLAPGTVLEVLAGPEEADGYTWWQVGNVIQGIEGWLAEGGVVSSGDCLRWLLPLESEDDMDDESEMDETAAEASEMDEMTDDESEPEEASEDVEEPEE